ncbi:MAG: radical SAM protein [Clostridium sp.]
MIVTNGTLSNRFDEIVKMPKELLEKLFFKFSFHYLELKRLNKIEDYFNNITKVKKAGCSYTVELTSNDEAIEEIEDIKEICKKYLGVDCHITIGRDDRKKDIDILSEYSFDDFKNIWKSFNSELFEFKTEIFYEKRKEFCYAGKWSYYLNLVTGELKQCYCGENIDNIYLNPNKALKEKAIGYNCELPHCYNGHAFLSLGIIPELETPYYAELRNKTNIKKEEWLTENMKSFMNKKLNESNKEYSNLTKSTIQISRKVKKVIFKIRNKVKYEIKNFKL